MLPAARTIHRRNRRGKSNGLGVILLAVTVCYLAGCKDRAGDAFPLVPDGSGRAAPGASPLERLCARAMPACGKIRAAAAEDRLRAKLDLEARLRTRSGHPMVCTASAGECLAAYAELFSLDWDRSRLPRGLRIVVAADTPSTAGSDEVVVSLRSPAAELESLLATPPARPLDAGTDVLGQLDPLLAGGASPRPELPEETSPACSNRQAFYDRIFAKDQVSATIVLGYIDQHLDSIRGYLRHVLLKLDPIPVFLRTQDEIHANMRSRFRASDFVEESRSPTELRFARQFYYRQQRKTLRVRVRFSIARCPGETTDSFGRLWRYDDQTCPNQQRATARARAEFADGLATSAILIYHGHSRWGRGLDFGPMSLRDGRLELDCRVLPCGGVSSAQTLVFIDSCDSLRHYGESMTKMRRALPTGHQLAWLAIDGDMRIGNSPQTTLRLLDMLVEARCPQEVLAVLNLPTHDGFRSRVVAEGL